MVGLWSHGDWDECLPRAVIILGSSYWVGDNPAVAKCR